MKMIKKLRDKMRGVAIKSLCYGILFGFCIGVSVFVDPRLVISSLLLTLTGGAAFLQLVIPNEKDLKDYLKRIKQK